jgi:hypothetical protein
MPKSVGKNVTYDVKDSKLVITVDLKQDNGKSKSGKTIMIATTNGNTRITGPKDEEVIFGLNVYKYPNEE